MSTTIDTVILHPLERAVEQDVEDFHSYAGRNFGEWMRFTSGLYPINGQGALGGTSPGGVPVMAGLSFFASGTDLLVQPGFVMQSSNSFPTPVGPLDSPARMGLLLAQLTLAIPDPGVDSYFLVQAQLSDTTINENRDFLDAVTRMYDPPVSIPKRLIHGLTITLKQGTAVQIPTPDANNVAIGAFFKATGANLLDDNTLDMRRVPHDFVGPNWVSPSATESLTYPICRQMDTVAFGSVSNAVTGRWSALLNGFLATCVTREALSVDLTGFLDPAETLTANRWYYLYAGQNPRGQIIGQPLGRVVNAYRDRNLQSNCVFAVSSVNPNDKGGNSAAVGLVRPFAGVSVSAGRLVCVGVVRRNNANTGWSAQRTSPAGDVSLAREANTTTLDQNSGVANGANRRSINVNLATGGTGSERMVPINVSSVRGSIFWANRNTGGTARTVNFVLHPSGSFTQGETLWIGPREITTVRASAQNGQFDVPVQRSQDQLFLSLNAFTDADTPTAATTAAIGVGNAWSLLLTGFRLS